MNTKDEKDIRRTLTKMIEEQQIQHHDIPKAIELAKLSVDGKQWRHFLQKLLLWTGAMSLVFGMIFFIAANWQHLGRFGKFILIELALVASLVPYFLNSASPRTKQACLLSAMLLTGGLMALFGQTYQTGADPWQLFFNWALLTLPWVVISQFSVMWMVWLGLLNLAMQQYFDLYGGYLAGASGLFLFNTSALVLWQSASRTFQWLNKPWAINLLGTLSGVHATALFVIDLFNDNPIGVLLWAVWCGVMYVYYRRIRLNIFMLAGLCLSLLVAANSLVIWALPNNVHEGTYLLLFILTIGGGSYCAIWLKRLLEEAANDGKHL